MPTKTILIGMVWAMSVITVPAIPTLAKMMLMKTCWEMHVMMMLTWIGKLVVRFLKLLPGDMRNIKIDNYLIALIALFSKMCFQ